MKQNIVSLGEITQIEMGQAPKGDSYNESGEGYPLIAGAGDFGELIPSPSKYTNSPTKISRPDDIIVCIRATIGDLNLSDQQYCLGRGVAAIRPKNNMIARRYLWRTLEAFGDRLRARGRGATFLQISKSDLLELEVPLPPLEEQKRIAAILDQADALHRRRRHALDRLNTLGQAIFHEMFGDPSTNPMNWPRMNIGEAVDKISDGPFGSNLKSSHYVGDGVRVWRLQNIGIGEIIDVNRAYISELHFNTIRKHECLPGDVIVGTLGEPNLRAFIQPSEIGRAINKADCVQIRPNNRIATAQYWAGLLNHPSTLRLAHKAVLGQTRSRISMGRLRALKIPVPNTALQLEYGKLLQKAEAAKANAIKAVLYHKSLFASLQARAFRGDL